MTSTTRGEAVGRDAVRRSQARGSDRAASDEEGSEIGKDGGCGGVNVDGCGDGVGSEAGTDETAIIGGLQGSPYRGRNNGIDRAKAAAAGDRQKHSMEEQYDHWRVERNRARDGEAAS